MDAFGFVILVAIAAIFFVIFLMEKVGQLRQQLKLPLPLQYFPEEKLFNCYQRAYMNTVENLPTFLVLLFIGGQACPIISSVAGVLWIIGRYLYARGYWTGNPEARQRGWISYIGLLILLLCSIGNALDRLGVIDII